MQKLSPNARELVQAGKRALEPSAADKARIRELVRERVASGPGAEHPSTAGGAKATAATAPHNWMLISAALLGTGAAVGVLLWGLSSGGDVDSSTELPELAVSAAPQLEATTPTELNESPPPAPVVSATTAPSADFVDVASLPTSEPVTTSQPRHSGSPVTLPEQKRANGHLSEEVALLSRATSALHAGQAQQALQALAEHAQRFPRGSLALERRTARAQALCMLGRKRAAAKELDGLSRSSPQVARAREFCEGK